MASTKKSSAADRTVSMFGEPVQDQDSRAVEAVQEDEKAERVPMEQDADRMREKAFTVQEWTTAAFGKPEAVGNQYRVSKRGEYYYVETLSKKPGAKEAYGYVGLMVHENDLFNLTEVMVRAVRDKQKAAK